MHVIVLFLSPCVFSSPEPKAQCELIGWEWSWRPSVLLSVMLSPPKPLDEIQPNFVCELLT